MLSRLVRSLAIAVVVGALTLAIVGALTLAGRTAAHATSASGTQNPDLTVAVSLANVGGGVDANTDTATAGENVTVSASVRNNTSRRQSVAVRVTLRGPNGFATSYSVRYPIGAGKTASISYDLTVQSDYPLGTYDLTVAASNRNGTSSATASIQIV
jgi:hypothetical protein